MRAFIEYPEVSDDRIEVKSEFVVETRQHYFDEISARTKENLDAISEYNRLIRAGLDERMAHDSYDAGIKTVDGIEMEPKQPRYRGDDQYWKDEC